MLDLSTVLFYEAVELKRKGRYEAAIAIYRGEISKMLKAGDFAEFTTYARAMAKCYYLKGCPQKALYCYNAIIQLARLTEGVRIMRDAQKDEYGRAQVRGWIASWAPEIGYALAYNAGVRDSSYADAIAGKGGDYSSEAYIDEGWRWFLDKFEEEASIASFLQLVESIL
ncbi:MAG: hypothetical protein IJ272_10120 [Clostridia bacterium]|nr:hypothetical protein [Clostridia bacterium]